MTIFEPVNIKELLEACLRLILSLLCGGLLGYERGMKKRPAGFRTYMLVCLGAALVMMTNEYVFKKFGGGDPARMAAQVISGIGFLGAGTIIVTGHNRVKGLTTAAGLWAAACIGLAIGIGYYGIGLISCLLIFTVMSFLHRLDDKVMSHAQVLEIYIEFEKIANIGMFIKFLREQGMKATGMEIMRSHAGDEVGVAVLMTIKLPQRQLHSDIVLKLHEAEGIRFMEEM